MNKRRKSGFMDFILDRIQDELGDKFKEFQDMGQEFMEKQREKTKDERSKWHNFEEADEKEKEKKKKKKSKKAGKKAKAKKEKKKSKKAGKGGKKTIIIEVKETPTKPETLAELRDRLKIELQTMKARNREHRKDMLESHRSEEKLFAESARQQIADWKEENA